MDGPVMASLQLALAGARPFGCRHKLPPLAPARQKIQRRSALVGAGVWVALVAGSAGLLTGATPAAAQQPEVMLLDGSDAPRYRAGDFVLVSRRSDLKVETDVVDTVEEGVLL